MVDVQDTLAACECPRLGWSMSFWITIADPQTGSIFYACPATGQTSWKPPVGVFIVPRQPGGEWWELADMTRGNRSYYYNTLTKVTQWDRPGGNDFVVPLGLIQNLAAPHKGLQKTATRSFDHLKPNKPETRERRNSDAASNETVKAYPRPPPPRRPVSRKPVPSIVTTPPAASTPGTVTGKIELPRRGRKTPKSISYTLSVVEEASDNGTEESQDGIGRNSFGVETTLAKGNDNRLSAGSDVVPSAVLVTTKTTGPTKEMYKGPFADCGVPGPPDHSPPRAVPFPTSNPKPTSRDRSPPAWIQLAEEYVLPRKTGLMRHPIPVDQILSWQEAAIKAPVLYASKGVSREACQCFKVIQHAMGERDKRVPGIQLDFSGEGINEKNIVLSEIRWMIRLCVLQQALRDEVFVQVMKQCNGNRNLDAMVLGFQLLCVLVNAFNPSQGFQKILELFLEHNNFSGNRSLKVMSKYCLKTLRNRRGKSEKGRILSISEIEHASDAAFHPSVFGESLEKIMILQKHAYPNAEVPVILTFLVDAIISLGGRRCPGIFRIPGDVESVMELKNRMDRGHYQLNGFSNAYVAASLLKLWLRDLPEPLIPRELYHEAILSSEYPDEAIELVNKLPIHHRKVLEVLISFLQEFSEESVSRQTDMSGESLAWIFASSVFNAPPRHQDEVFSKSVMESRFLLQLIEHWELGM